MKVFAALLCLFFLASCGSYGRPPFFTNFDSSHTFTMTKDEVWNKLMRFFTGGQIAIKTIEKDSGVIAAEPLDFTPGFYADCGRSIAAVVAKQANLNVFVEEISAAETSVIVNTSFSIVRQWSGETFRVTCFSTGVLERDIFMAIDFSSVDF